MNHQIDHQARSDSRWFTGRTGWVLAGFLAIAILFLWTEHRAHLLGALPWLLLLACPFLHFLHGGHGHGSHTDHSSKGDPS